MECGFYTHRTVAWAAFSATHADLYTKRLAFIEHLLE